MLFILSEESDRSTTLVQDWLEELQVAYIRINKGQKPILKKLSFDPEPRFVLDLEGRPLDSNDITAYWYRRGTLDIDWRVSLPSGGLFATQARQYFRDEQWCITQCLYSILRSKPRINSFEDNFISKLSVLSIATAEGLRTPATLIAQERELLLAFAGSHTGVITKSIQDLPRLRSETTSYSVGTELTDASRIRTRDPCSLPSLLQEYVEKDFEIRSFFLIDTFYSMAIFSQGDAQTKIDFRNYNFGRMNRMVPFRLPADIEQKLRRVCNRIGLNCGSADLIYSAAEGYTLLEINPVGQFGMVSYPCNYNLEYKIAQKLAYACQ